MEYAMSKAEDALKGIGVTIRGETADSLRGIEEIIDDVADAWDTLSDSQRQAVSEAMAGTQRSSMFFALIENYEKVKELREIGLNAEDELAKANQVRVESLAGLQGQLEVTKQALYATLLSQDDMMGILKGTDSLLQGFTKVVAFIKNEATTVIGTFLTLLTAMEVKMYSMGKGGLVLGIKSQIETFILSIARLMEQMGLATTIAGGFFGALGIVGGVMLGVKALTTLHKAVKETTPSIEELTSQFGELKKATEEYKEASEELEEVRVDVDSMRDKIALMKEGNLTQEREKELAQEVNDLLAKHAPSYTSIEDILKGEVVQLESKVGLLEKEAEAKERLAKIKVIEQLNEKTGILAWMGIGSTQLEKFANTTEKTLGRLKKAYFAYNTSLSEAERKGLGSTVALEKDHRKVEVLKGELEQLAQTYAEQMQTIRSLEGVADQAMIDSWVAQLDTIRQTLEEGAKKYNIELDLYFDISDAQEQIADLSEEAKGAFKAIGDFSKGLDNSDIDKASTSLDILSQNLQKIDEGSEEAKSMMEQLRSTFTDMPKEIDTLADAIDYLNKELSKTADAAKLKELNDDYIKLGENMQEAQKLLNSLLDTPSIDTLRRAFDSDLLNDFNGSFTDTVAIADHLTNKIREMEDAMYSATANMALANNEAWDDMTSKMAESLGTSVSDFQDFVNKVNGLRQVDLKNCENATQAQNLMEAQLATNGMKYYVEMINSKASNRQTDMQNVIEFLNTQGAKEAQTVQQLADMWAAFYKAKADAINAEIQEFNKKVGEMNKMGHSLDSWEGFEDMIMGKNGVSKTAKHQYSKLQEQLTSLNNLNSSFTNYFSGIKDTFKGITGGLSQSLASTEKLTNFIKNYGKDSGKKGSSGSKDKNKDKGKDSKNEVADLDLKIDKFREYEEAVNRASEALQRNQEAQRMVSSKSELKKLLTDEIDLMKKKKESLGKLQEEYKKEQEFLKSRLEISGLIFKGDEIAGDKITGGSIADRLKDAEKWSNAASGKEKEWRINDTVNFQKNIDAYYELMNQLGKVTSEYNDMVFEIEQTKKAHEELLKQIENLVDRYYELEDAISDTGRALDRFRRKKDDLTTVEEAIKYHKEENKLIQDKINVYEKLLAEQNKAKEESRKELASKGFKFDEFGNVINYKDRIKELQDYANTLAGNAQKAQIEHIESLNEMINKYTDLTNSAIPKTEDAILDLKDEIKDANKEFEEMIKTVEKLGEKYYGLTVLLNKIDSALALNKTLQESATGERRVELLNEEIKLIREKQSLLMQQKEAYEQTASSLKGQLVEYGVAFKEDGTISNYEWLAEMYEKRANTLVGEARDKVLKEYEKLVELMKEYDEVTLDSLPHLTQEWEKYSNTIKEIEKSKLESITNVEKKITSALENELTKRYNRIKESIQKQKDLYNKQYQQEDWDKKLSAEQRKLDEIKQQMVELSRDTSASGQAKLEQLKQEYQQQLDAINDMIRENEKELGNQRFDEEINKIEEELKDAISPENLANMVNQALVSGFATVGDEVVELNALMTDWLNKTGDGLYSIGDYLKNELIASLQEAKTLMQDVGITGDIASRSMRTIVDADVNPRGRNTGVVFNAPFLEIQGNITEEVFPRVQSMIQTAKNEIITDIERVINQN